MFVLLIPFIQQYILSKIAIYIQDERIGAILASICLFFMPSMLMGIINPVIVKLELDSIKNAGRIAGRLSAIGTIGGLTGTLLGGFVLIPNIGSVYILYMLNIIICLLIVLTDLKLKDKYLIFIAISVILSILCMTTSLKNNNDNGEKVLNGEVGVTLSQDTQYGRVLIYNGYINNNKVRVLNIDSGYESATFVDENKVNELVFDYTKNYDLMFNANNNIKDVLLIGGAGYSYPKYYISNYEDKNLDVVEIDEKITEIAKKYFYLDKLIKDYNLENNKRLNLINADGRVYLNNNTKKYEAILNDAFSGETPAKTLTTLENVSNIKKSLTEDGVYLTNIISSLEGDNSKFLRAEVNTIKRVFKNVYVIPCAEIHNTQNVINIMVIASDKDLNFENNYNLDIKENEIVLTDDYCPVDTIIPR